MTDKWKQLAETKDRQLRELPEEVIFCKRCVVSNQRPRITFDEEGVCSACRFAEMKQRTIDWDAREKELCALLDKHRSKDGSWDVILPCSGGKDGSVVGHKLKHKYGMNPLTITWSPFKYTDIGRKNFQSFMDSGFNNLLATQNGKLHRIMARRAFELLGDAWQPFTYGQVCFAFHIAVRFGIKLIFFGENGEAEYGGTLKHAEIPGVPVKDWAEVYFKGAMPRDLLSPEDFKEHGISPSDLTFYEPPAMEDLLRVEPEMHYFGYYEKWIPQENYYYAVKHTGFEANPERSEGTYSKYASLDDRLDGFHFYFAFLKFGIGRATSDAAHEIRDGHLTREEGVALVRRYDGEFPRKYFDEFLEYLNIDEEKFWEVADRYRRPNIWTKNGNEWVLRHQVS